MNGVFQQVAVTTPAEQLAEAIDRALTAETELRTSPRCAGRCRSSGARRAKPVLVRQLHPGDPVHRG